MLPAGAKKPQGVINLIPNAKTKKVVCVFEVSPLLLSPVKCSQNVRLHSNFLFLIQKQKFDQEKEMTSTWILAGVEVWLKDMGLQMSWITVGHQKEDKCLANQLAVYLESLLLYYLFFLKCFSIQYIELFLLFENCLVAGEACHLFPW